MTSYDPVLFAKQAEETETMLSQCGPLVKAYYDTLVSAGLSSDFARELTLRWHDIFWQNALDWRRTQNV